VQAEVAGGGDPAMWPATIAPAASMSTGLTKPNWRMPAAICRICFLEWVRGVRAAGWSPPIGRYSMASVRRGAQASAGSSIQPGQTLGAVCRSGRDDPVICGRRRWRTADMASSPDMCGRRRRRSGRDGALPCSKTSARVGCRDGCCLSEKPAAEWRAGMSTSLSHGCLGRQQLSCC
jgi:hypothetical protein